MAATVSGKLGVPAESIERPVTEHIDTLYFGSAIYAAVVDWRVKKFIKTLTPDKVGRVICFSSAAIIDSNYQKVKALFEKQGIPVDERQFTCRGSMGPIHAGHPDKADHEALAAFIESTI